MFVVLSVFSGLREFSLSFSNDFDPDLKIIPSTGKTLVLTNQQNKEISEIDEILDFSKVIEERVLFFFDGKEQVAYLKGVDKSFIKTNVVSNKLFNGKWLTEKTAEVVIGYGVSEKLSLGLFDFNNPFEVYVPRKGKGVIESEAEAFNKAVLFQAVFVDLVLRIYLYSGIYYSNHFETHALKTGNKAGRVRESFLVKCEYPTTVHVVDIKVYGIARDVVFPEVPCHLFHIVFRTVAVPGLVISQCPEGRQFHCSGE